MCFVFDLCEQSDLAFKKIRNWIVLNMFKGWTLFIQSFLIYAEGSIYLRQLFLVIMLLQIHDMPQFDLFINSLELPGS